MKIAKFVVSALVASSVAFGAGSDCVCFKLKGEMGEELKALIEKYHGELAQAKTSAKNVDEESSAFSIFTVEEKKAITKTDRIAKGKRIYEKSCAKCHGSDGMKEASSNSMAIANMNFEEMEDAIKGYRNGDYGESMKYSMIPYAELLTNEEMRNIVEYLHSLKK
jgi:mono/diheme cytochrome c family protein